MFLLIDDRINGDCFTEEFETAEEAIERGAFLLSYNTAAEKKRMRSYCVIESGEGDAFMEGDVIKEWIVNGRSVDDED